MRHSLDLPGVPRSLMVEFRRAALDAGVARLALVGGVVRDLLLYQLHDVPWTGVEDLDWVVEGDVFALTKSLLRSCGSQRVTDIQCYRAYGTVALRYEGIAVDLASARCETYPVPAQNPKTVSGSLEQDLSRRDFTINAMAIDLISENLVDCHSGHRGLIEKQLTFLHHFSVRDDPTRVIRAARYAARLGFNVDESSKAQITQTILDWPWAWSQGDLPENVPPALSTRLRMELERLFRYEPWSEALLRLQQWRALSLIDCSLQNDPLLIRRLNWSRRLGLPLLPALISGAENPPSVARRLQLPGHQYQWLVQLTNLSNWLESDAPAIKAPPSVWSESLEMQGATPESVALLICRMPTQWKQLLRWWGRWRKIKSSKTANELIDLGWNPGPSLGQELKRLRKFEQDKSR